MREGKRALHIRTREEVHPEQEPQVLADPPVPEVGTAPTQSELERTEEEAEKLGEVGVVADPTVGPDGCRGWTIYIGWGGEPARRRL